MRGGRGMVVDVLKGGVGQLVDGKEGWWGGRLGGGGGGGGWGGGGGRGRGENGGKR